MNDVGEFLAHAIKLEEEAAQRFSELADAMDSYGNAEVSGFFRQMAKFSRMHLEIARERSGFRDIPKLEPEAFRWPGGQSPESASAEGLHYMMTIDYAFDIALEGERAAHDFYAGVLDKTQDPEIRAMAEEFVTEEAEHVADLERWQARYAKSGNPAA